MYIDYKLNKEARDKNYEKVLEALKDERLKEPEVLRCNAYKLKYEALEEKVRELDFYHADKQD